MSELTPELQKKVQQWSNLGLVVHTTEMELQAMSQAAVSKLKIPTSIDEVGEAERLVKEVKADYNNISAKRKSLTSKFDSLTSRLMIPEKQVLESIPQIEQAIIALKRIDEENRNKLKYKSDEMKSVREFLINYMNQKDAEYTNKIIGQCSKAYNYALGAGNIDMAGLPEYIAKCKSAKGFTDHDFIWDLPTITTKHITHDDVLVVWNEVLPQIKEGKHYVEMYYSELDKKFEFYSVAIKNKEDAIKLEQQNKAEAEAKIKQELENKQIAAKLEALATTIEPTVDSGVKQLKKKYEVDLDDTKESAVKIIAAFVSSLHLVEGGIRVKSWSSLSVGQMAAALAWYKNKDEKFECGISFKITEKL